MIEITKALELLREKIRAAHHEQDTAYDRHILAKDPDQNSISVAFGKTTGLAEALHIVDAELKSLRSKGGVTHNDILKAAFIQNAYCNMQGDKKYEY